MMDFVVIRFAKRTRIRNQEISHSPEASPSISNRLINTTDTLIDLAGVILKILSRIPVFKLSTKEVNRILNASNISEKERIDYQSIKVLNINQKILLGIGNQQSTQINTSAKD